MRFDNLKNEIDEVNNKIHKNMKIKKELEELQINFYELQVWSNND